MCPTEAKRRLGNGTGVHAPEARLWWQPRTWVLGSEKLES